ncbi:unnamed protein product [Cuscuta epithymum]|uniref:FAD-binding PCMH-type domain-containing protein n=1 Tax=Cuscuta epithymum TaxID=186058 RepID=A0AAV0DYA0_9ASTE|nr:unnamed protein product [Cuscuta epithymum]
MKAPNTFFRVIISLLLILWLSSHKTSASNPLEEFQHCLLCASSESQSPVTNHDIIYTAANSSFLSILQSSIKNTRFNTSNTPKPLIIATPREEFEVQYIINCAKELGLRVRVRSGGHDYEGLSYTTRSNNDPFLVIDLINFKNITIDVFRKTAWVGSGSTVGELYYSISQKSRTLGFPAGVCHSIGIGGHISGGGYGTLLRKYGLAADNVIDARLVDANGTILDRKSMGEDLFWAIRGGGGNTFGIVLSWKVQLVDVPENVTVFNVGRTLEQNATNLVHKWQSVAPKLPKELFIRVIALGTSNSTLALFQSLFLGPIDKLLPILGESFPELGVTRQDLTEMRWIDSTLYFDGIQNVTDYKALFNTIPNKGKPYFFKAKSDYVKEPMSIEGLEGVWRFLGEDRAGLIILSPYGGRMDEISESAIPFPHRAGNLYKILYLVSWGEDGDDASEMHIGWIRRLYNYTTPFVSKSPREAYINYRDLDIGLDEMGRNNFEWGSKYFKNNFNQLAMVKTRVDPENFFRNEQSVPVLVE